MIEFESKSQRTSTTSSGTPGLLHETPAEPWKLEDGIRLCPDKLVDDPPSEFHEFALIPTNVVVPCRRPPEAEPCNAHTDELEYEISREWMPMRGRQAIGAGVPIEFKTNQADPSLLLWYAAAVVTGCLGWLLYFIFGALN
jgi:hypothetical protein